MVTTQLATAATLEATSRPGFKYELIRGEIREMAAASGGDHGRFAARAIAPMLVLLTSNPGLGDVFIADAGFFIERDPDTVVAPDAAFVRASDLPPIGSMRGFAPIVPTLVIEVVSPSDSRRAVEEKIAIYRDAGVPLIWTVQPKTWTVWVDGAGSDRVIKTETDTLDGGDVLPELPPLPVRNIFR